MTTPHETEQHLSNLFISFGKKYNVNPETVGVLLNLTAFKQRSDREITKAEMIALLIVAETYNLNPFTKEIYAFSDDDRIYPVVGVDGWSRIINDQDSFDGMTFSYAEELIAPSAKAQQCPEWIECLMHRKDRKHPVVVREYLAETYRDTAQWNAKTRRMLRHKAMIQCARYAFGLVGIYDQDEVEHGVQANIAHESKKSERPAVMLGGLEQAREVIAKAASGSPVASGEAQAEEVQAEAAVQVETTVQTGQIAAKADSSEVSAEQQNAGGGAEPLVAAAAVQEQSTAPVKTGGEAAVGADQSEPLFAEA